VMEPTSSTQPRVAVRLPLSHSREQRIHQLLMPEPMGNRTPSQYLRYLRSLDPDVPVHLLRTIWTMHLPRDVQIVLAAQLDVELNTAACCADRIVEAISRPSLARISQPTDNAELAKSIAELSRQLEALSTELNRLSSRDRPSSSRDRPHGPRDRPSSPRNRRPYNRSPSRHRTTTTPCWYHRRFGDQAYNCSPPCTYSQQGY
jgi:hypothetical protein